MSYLISIDTERTGDRLSQHHMFNLGTVVKNIHTKESIDKIDIIINMPEDRKWDPSTRIWVNQQQKMADIVQTMENGMGVSIEDGMGIFVNFIKKYYERYGGDIVIGMDHLDIDSTWINYYLDISGRDPLHKVFGKLEFMVDFSSYHKGCVKITHKKVKEFTKFNTINFSPHVAAFRYFNIRSPIKKESHRAVEDAEYNADSHIEILKAIEKKWFSK